MQKAKKVEQAVSGFIAYKKMASAASIFIPCRA